MENTTINLPQSETLTESKFRELFEDDEYDIEYPEYDDVSPSI